MMRLMPLLSLVLIVGSASQILAAAPNCASNGFGPGTAGSNWDPVTQGPKNPPVSTIVCTGTCPDSSQCPTAPAGVGADNKGPYAFCACPNEGESPCCHLRITNGTYVPGPGGGDNEHNHGLIRAMGNCQLPGCPTPPVCKRIGDGIEISFQAICANE